MPLLRAGPLALGLVWGWLLARRSGGTAPARRALTVLYLVDGSLLASLQVLWLLGRAGLFLFWVGGLASLLLHLAWLRELRRHASPHPSTRWSDDG